MFNRVVLTIVLTIAFSSNVFAASWTGANTIGKVLLKRSGEIWVYPATSNWNLGNETCTSDSFAVIRGGKFDTTQMYASLLISKLENIQIDLHFHGCRNIDLESYPVVTDLQFD